MMGPSGPTTPADAPAFPEHALFAVLPEGETDLERAARRFLGEPGDTTVDYANRAIATGVRHGDGANRQTCTARIVSLAHRSVIELHEAVAVQYEHVAIRAMLGRETYRATGAKRFGLNCIS